MKSNTVLLTVVRPEMTQFNYAAEMSVGHYQLKAPVGARMRRIIPNRYHEVVSCLAYLH